MSKKILIIINEFNIGGTIASLYMLLSKIDPQMVQVDVFPRVNLGAYADKLPNCTILPENLWLSHTIYKKGFIIRKANYLLLCIRKFFEKMDIDMYRIFNYIGGNKLHTNRYDAVIGFDESLPRYVCTLPAHKRINWIHCDYRRFAKGKDESRYYDKIDTVVCVSEFAKNIFCEYYPKYSNKTVAIHNIINVEDLLQKSTQPVDDDRFKNTDFTIISCGRLDPVKQFNLIPSIVEKIKQKTDRSFQWYIIGGGNDVLQEQIQNEINQYGVSEYVKLLGMKTNPYTYMVKSDLFVCTSCSESYPMVVNEAKALGIPVVCNTFPSASESVRNGENGYIVGIERMPEVIASMIEKPIVLKQRDSENIHILEQFYNLF